MSKEKRDSYVFYRSFEDAIRALPPEEELKLRRAISDFSLDFVEPVLDGLAKVIWGLMRPNLHANNQRFRNGLKGAEHGQKGGRPKPLKNPKQNREKTPSKTPSKTRNKDKDKDVNKDKDNYPSMNEFVEYALQHKSNLDRESIELKYKAWKENGWKDGHGNVVKNWKSKLLQTIPHLKELKQDPNSSQLSLKDQVINHVPR